MTLPITTFPYKTIQPTLLLTTSFSLSSMEGLGFLKFWRNASAGTRVISHAGDLRSAAVGSDDEGEATTCADDSFFDLVIRSPDGGEILKKELRLSGSPRDVFRSKDDVSCSKPLSPATLLRSAPKFKVFMLGFRKSAKCEKTASSNGEVKGSPLNHFSKSTRNVDESNHFSAECSVEETSVSSTFAGDNSLRKQLLKETSDNESPHQEKSSEGTVPKYLKLIRPLYLKVSKRQNKKAKLTTSFTPTSSPVPVNTTPRKLSASSRGGSFKVIAKHLVKSRSASAMVGIAPPPSLSQRRDDSLLEQHDGIQGAILYCKRSYNSSSEEFSQLFRSSSDPCNQKQVHPARTSCELQTRCSI